ncbi:DNA-binding protein RFX2 isoform X3 [Halyomorpha halys]|uniref:DNA-binding protein RFX2 isoform X3 n=1 Tax=Halyomorpha halys TaxID=286706 RepID=UPI0006D4FDBA|nr:transcription factor RFX3 isoform X3 [Halyomorpha halys]
MSVKVEFIEGDYLEQDFTRSESIKVVRFQESLTKRKRGRPRKIKTESEWEMASQGGDTTVTVVPQTQILQVSQPAVSVQLSPENSVDSSHSITVTAHPSIQEEGGVLSSGGNSEEGIQGPESSPGHYITVTASEGGGEDVTHSYVQYIESTGEQTIYTTSNGQMYPVYTVGESGAMYTPSSGQYYSPGNTTPVTYTQDVAYLVNASGGGSQISDSTPDSSTTASNAPNIVHATRVSPTTVQWLLENYETAEGVSLPRSTLYNHYLRHCYENKLDPVNAASFGKLIRSVFLGLRTRRLGTRGNSKYHYYGIRLKASSSLLCQSQDSGGEEGSSRGGKRFRVSQTKLEEPVQATPLQEYLGDSSQAIPELPEVEIPPGLPLPHMCSLEDIDTFRSIYREHCEAFLDAIVNLEFATIETLWREFWRSQENTNGDECEEEKYLSKTKLFMISKLRPVQEFVKRVDFLFYQNLVQVLIPDVLRPIPSSLTQAIRNFAKGLESWLSSAMVGCPPDMVDIKVSAVCALGQTLRRYTSLNHLAQAARAVLQNSVQINQMLADLNRVDFHNVQEQASWVCECDGGLVARLEADFKTTLQTQNSLEEWASWLKAVVNSVLKPYRGRRGFSAAARQLLLKWSFYSSMVIRDLTLRSAASFGSFHLIRLLYDEYMFYLVEHQVASATGTSPIAVMATKSCGLDYSERNGNNNNNNTNINNNKEGESEPLTKKMRLS